MNTRLSPRYAAASQLFPFDKERIRRRRARWGRVWRVGRLVVGSLAVVAIAAMLFMLWLVRHEQ